MYFEFKGFKIRPISGEKYLIHVLKFQEKRTSG